jgi:hypothetical protein
MAGRKGEGAAFGSVRSLCVGSANHLGGGTEVEGAALATISSFVVRTARHSYGRHDR